MDAEIRRKILEGVSPREAELWLAEECERAAVLLRKEEPTSREACLKALDAFRGVLFAIENAIRDA